MTNVTELKKEWMQEAEFASEYEALSDEFAVAHMLIRARTNAGLTQAQVAEKMDVSQARIAKLESGVNVSISSLNRYAAATGTRLNISLDPA